MSREKGNAAEREVAALLQTWWRQVEPEATFVRTPLSGGWGVTREVRAGFRASGDLMTTALRFPFTVEVKRREAWTMKTVEAGRASPVWGWWRQAQAQAEEMQLVPLLWMRRSRVDWSVMLPWSYVLRHRAVITASVKDWLETGIAGDHGTVFPAMMAGADWLRVSPYALALPQPSAPPLGAER